jgi:hypothetical protein
MIYAIIRRFGFFQVSGFLQSRNLLAEHLAQMNAERNEFFSHTVPTEFLSAQSVRFCTILSESWTPGQPSRLSPTNPAFTKSAPAP